ncbi:hypothetical protein C2W62_17045 [Candidatus Entotheonella serta]|nr:hypothetical protein C2W62_17045 [Candidatus Entotheonella serta]
MRPLYRYFGNFRLDEANACLWRGNERLALRPKTFSILMHLVAHAGQLVTKEELLDEVWPDAVVSDGVLKTSVRDLRQMLGEKARAPQFIATTVWVTGLLHQSQRVIPMRYTPLLLRYPLRQPRAAAVLNPGWCRLHPSVSSLARQSWNDSNRALSQPVMTSHSSSS